MSRSMKRLVPYILAAAGVIVLLLVLPVYRPSQPRGVSVTREQAREIANRAARDVGIPVQRAWATLVWWPSPILEKELRDHPRRADAWSDPVLGPRLNSYRVTYYHLDKEKFPPHGI